jgi:hypothetical protein
MNLELNMQDEVLNQVDAKANFKTDLNLSSQEKYLNLKSLSNHELVESFKRSAQRERGAILEVVRHVHEFMRRRLYLEFNCTSIFQYLTEELHYPKSTAQSRIDAARLLGIAPELQTDLKSGAINLTQISVFAQALRQVKKENPAFIPSSKKKEEILRKIRNCDIETSAVFIARELDLNLKKREKTHHQKDESVVLELTFTKEEFSNLRRVKDISSHINHDATWAQVISLLASEYLKRKDLTVEKIAPLKAKEKSRAVKMKSDKVPASKEKTNEALEVSSELNQAADLARGKVPASKEKTNKTLEVSSDPNQKRQAISIFTKREIAKRGWQCEALDAKTGKRCQSTYQLQFDHIHPVHAGGGNNQENLQLLCAIHNRLKYQRGG